MASSALRSYRSRQACRKLLLKLLGGLCDSHSVRQSFTPLSSDRRSHACFKHQVPQSRLFQAAAQAPEQKQTNCQARAAVQQDSLCTRARCKASASVIKSLR